MLTRLVCAILVSTACPAGLYAQAGAESFEQAMDDYANARYVRAEGGFRAAAERGNVRAQEVLGFMYAFGPNLYPGIQYNRHEAAVWFERAANGGSDSARYMYCALTRHAATYRLRGAACGFAGTRGAERLGRK